MRTGFTVRMAGLVALFGRCYNALTVWPTGNRLPLVSDARALEKTLLRSFPTSIKKPATLWSPLNLQNFLRLPGRVVKQPNGIPRLQSAFAAPIGRPKLRKLQRVLADRLLQIRSRYPTICSWPHLLLPLPSPARLLSKPRLCLKRLSLLPLSFRAATSPKRRDAVCAAVAAAAAVIVEKPAPVPTLLRCFLLRRRRELRSTTSLLRQWTKVPSLALAGSVNPSPRPDYLLSRWSRTHRPPCAVVTAILVCLRGFLYWKCNSAAC